MKLQNKILISFVIPVKDEEKTIAELSINIINIVHGLGVGFDAELIIVDDGSTDDSWLIMCQLAKEYQGTITALRLRRNFGKSVALQAGFRRAGGDIVFTMDGDLQDDPNEIPRFLEELKKGFDLISGWKRQRHDPLSKTLPSLLFNKITAWATGIHLHDINCGFKCYKNEIVKSINIYGELHRYIPVIAHDLGYKIGEIEVKHHPRLYGVSKYGWSRYLRGSVDLVTVLATTRWLNKPGHLFGGMGVCFGLVGSGCLLYLIVLWSMGIRPIGNRPMLILGVMLCILSVQMISLGIVAEFFVRTQNHSDVDNLVSESVENNTKCQITPEY